MQVSIRAHMYSNMYMYMYIYTHPCIHICTYTHVHACMHLHAHVHTWQIHIKCKKHAHNVLIHKLTRINHCTYTRNNHRDNYRTYTTVTITTDIHTHEQTHTQSHTRGKNTSCISSRSHTHTNTIAHTKKTRENIIKTIMQCNTCKNGPAVPSKKYPPMSTYWSFLSASAMSVLPAIMIRAPKTDVARGPHLCMYVCIYACVHVGVFVSSVCIFMYVILVFMLILRFQLVCNGLHPCVDRHIHTHIHAYIVQGRDFSSCHHLCMSRARDNNNTTGKNTMKLPEKYARTVLSSVNTAFSK